MANVKIDTQVTIPWDKLNSKDERTVRIMIQLASGIKPRQICDMYNQTLEEGEKPLTQINIRTIKCRNMEAYNIMHDQVLDYIRRQYLDGALQMALERVQDALVKYEAIGRQGSLTETINAVQCLDKLRDKYTSNLATSNSEPEKVRVMNEVIKRLKQHSDMTEVNDTDIPTEDEYAVEE